MNEKIKELAFHAGFIGENMFPIVGISQETALNNFAELIIRNYCNSHKFTKNPWIAEYPGEVFVVFDPMTDGSSILGAARTFDEAQNIFDYCDNNRERQYKLIFKLIDSEDDQTESIIISAKTQSDAVFSFVDMVSDANISYKLIDVRLIC